MSEDPKEVQVAPAHYEWMAYVTRERWLSYWHQIRLVAEIKPRSCAIVGAGDSWVARVLESMGVQIVSIDHSHDLHPSLVGDLRALPLSDAGVDVVLCCQVLEHLPWASVGACLKELGRIASRRAVVSVPQRGRSWSLRARIPYIGEVSRGGTLRARRPFEFDGEHYWEANTIEHSIGDVEAELLRVFGTFETFIEREDLYRRFYVADLRG
jgi:ubiquinone/menaquinone biosynthesis C-methylase UbiE